MNGGNSIIRRPGTEKSNTELTNSLRANLLASTQAAAPIEPPKENPPPDGILWEDEVNRTEQFFTRWTSREPHIIYAPSIDFTSSGILEDRPQYDITVKLFFLPTTRLPARRAHAREAVSLVLRELHVDSIDLLIVSFPGISFDADDDGDEELSGEDEGAGETIDNIVETWRALEKLHADGTVAQIGLAEFGSERLRKFLPRAKVRPSVDQINVRDCCVVPKSLILFAKEEKIELLTHNDCTNILPKGTVRELLGKEENGAGLLANSESEEGLKGEIEPQWVIKYTAVVRDRGVIENKGYFAMAEMEDPS